MLPSATVPAWAKQYNLDNNSTKITRKTVAFAIGEESKTQLTAKL